MNAAVNGESTQRAATGLLSRALAFEADVLPLAYDGTNLTVAVGAHSDELVERIRQQTRKNVRTVVLPLREIRDGLKRLYPPSGSRDGDSQAALALDEIFAAAIAGYASDVHVEPLEGEGGRVRLDVDGVLQHERSLEPGLFERIVALLKVVLKHLAATLAAGARPVDLVARIGGDEFAVAFLDVDAALARALVRRLSGGLAAAGLRCSLGAALSRPGETLETVLGRADGALYAVKAAGKNGYAFAD